MVSSLSDNSWRIVTPVGIHLHIQADDRRWLLTTDDRGLHWLEHYHGPRLGEGQDFQESVAEVPD